MFGIYLLLIFGAALGMVFPTFYSIMWAKIKTTAMRITTCNRTRSNE